MEAKHRNCLLGQKQYVLSIDVGSTIIKGHVYDKNADINGTASMKMEVIHPQHGWVEIEPDFLWTQFTVVIKESVQDAGIKMNQIAGIGISTQRATFITWNKKTGQPFHNFISWQDLRAADLVKSWNYSVTLKAIHGSCKMHYFLTRNKRFQAASLITFTTQHVSLRLLWVLQNIPEVQNAAEEGNFCFGTIDTWLLYRLTKGSVYATDYSNASSTGIFDPYQICWSTFLGGLLSIPMSIFPPVMDTSKKCGSIEASIFGAAIPIKALVADQQSAMFGECCFLVGDVKFTMGTGTFVAINTGETVHTSTTGLYPLIGWKIGSEIVFLAEGNSSDTGTAVKWAQKLNLFNDVDETTKMAKSLQNSDCVYFVPSFSGLQAPVNDPWACAAFIGLNTSTTKCHLVRAILESIAFRNKQLYDTLLNETAIPITDIKADGGVCNNGFVMQMTADLLNKSINKPQYAERLPSMQLFWLDLL